MERMGVDIVRKIESEEKEMRVKRVRAGGRETTGGRQGGRKRRLPCKFVESRPVRSIRRRRPVSDTRGSKETKEREMKNRQRTHQSEGKTAEYAAEEDEEDGDEEGEDEVWWSTSSRGVGKARRQEGYGTGREDEEEEKGKKGQLRPARLASIELLPLRDRSSSPTGRREKLNAPFLLIALSPLPPSPSSSSCLLPSSPTHAPTVAPTPP